MKRKTIIKSAIFVLVCAVIAIGLFSCLHKKYLYYRYGMIEYSLSDFRHHKHAYQVVATKLMNAYQSERRKNPDFCSLVVFDNSTTVTGEWEFEFKDALGDTYLISSNATEEEMTCLDEVLKSMNSNKTRGGLRLIKVENDCVFFRACSPYYLVCDFSGDFYSNNKKDDSLFISKLSSKWYEVLNIKTLFPYG